MTDKTINRLRAHFTKLSKDGGDTGNSVRDNLIKADAQRHLDALNKRHPNKKKRVAPKVVDPVKDPVVPEGKEDKSEEEK